MEEADKEQNKLLNKLSEINRSKKPVEKRFSKQSRIIFQFERKKSWIILKSK